MPTRVRLHPDSRVNLTRILPGSPNRHHVRMAAFDVRHHDPAPVARAAAVRSAQERDASLRDRARAQSMVERLREGFVLARFGSQLRDAARR